MVVVWPGADFLFGPFLGLEVKIHEKNKKMCEPDQRAPGLGPRGPRGPTWGPRGPMGAPWVWEQLDKDLVEIGFKEREGQAYEDITNNELVIKRVSYPDDVKGTAAFLASHDSDYMTGQMLHIDGGWCIQ